MNTCRPQFNRFNPLSSLFRILEFIMQQLIDLQAQVAATNTIEASAVVLLQGLKTQLDAAIASNDPAALTALSDSLGTSNAALAAAITANTPAAPPAPAPAADGSTAAATP